MYMQIKSKKNQKLDIKTMLNLIGIHTQIITVKCSTTEFLTFKLLPFKFQPHNGAEAR